MSPTTYQQKLALLRWRAPRVPQRSVVEATNGSGWVAARVWNTEAKIESIPVQPDSFRVVLGVNGQAAVEGEKASFLVRPRDLVVWPGSARIRVETTTSWARNEWHVRIPFVEFADVEKYLEKPLRISDSFHTLLTTMTNVVSTSSSFESSPGGRSIHAGLASAIEGALLDAIDWRTNLTPSQAKIYDDALRIIEQRHGDPDFDVGQLIDRLPVGKAYLHRVFSMMGTTPRRALESRRVATAQGILHSAPATGKGAASRIAHLSGFRSSQSMHAALERAPTRTSRDEGR